MKPPAIMLMKQQTLSLWNMHFYFESKDVKMARATGVCFLRLHEHETFDADTVTHFGMDDASATCGQLDQPLEHHE